MWYTPQIFVKAAHVHVCNYYGICTYNSTANNMWYTPQIFEKAAHVHVCSYYGICTYNSTANNMWCTTQIFEKAAHVCRIYIFKVHTLYCFCYLSLLWHVLYILLSLDQIMQKIKLLLKDKPT